MPTYEEARRIILASVAPLGAERVDILDSVGRVIAEDIVAPWNMPLCDNSAMDGYAVRAADCREGVVLRVTGYIPAGALPTHAVEPGAAIKIMTGAPTPPECDAVVPVEVAEEHDGHVRINAAVKLRQHVRFTGEDVRCGEIIMHRGTIVRPPEVSMLASFGKASVPVYTRPRVAIVSTGDELVELGEPLGPGKIINSNAHSLAAAVKLAGAIPVLIGIARDNVASHRERLIEGLKADALITSAGVSAGDRDLVRDVLDELGAEQVFWRVDIKPGGPTAFALKDCKPVFSLPGNPVSTMITFEEFVRPALLKMMGHQRVFKRLVPVVLQAEVKKKAGKTNFLRVRLEAENGRLLAYSSGEQTTGILRTMLRADAIAVLPADRTSFAPGEEVLVHVLAGNVDMSEA